MTLWKFFITIRRDPYLAGLVRTLTIGNWGFYPPPYPEKFESQFSCLQFPSDELDLVRVAIRDAGVEDLEESIIRSLSEHDRRPLMALLLVSLPNLQTVSAYIPRRGPVLGAVLEKAVCCQDDGNYSPGLRCLKELHLFYEIPVKWSINWTDAEPNVEDSDYDVDVSEGDSGGGGENDDHDDDDDDGKKHALRIDYLWPVFYLSNIRILFLSDLDCTGTVTRILCNRVGGICQLEELSITSDTLLSEGWVYSDILTLISRPRALKSLTFYLDQDLDLDFINLEDINTDFWNCLQEQRTSLEHLDIYMNWFYFQIRQTDIVHFGPLSEFTRLKHISIQVEILLGKGKRGNVSTAPFRLRDTLPTSLRSLTFYGREGYSFLDDLPVHLMELILSRDFPSLKTIVLEEMAHCRGPRYGDLKLTYQAVKDACRERDIYFQIKSEYNVRKCEKCQDIFKKTQYLWDDGCERREKLIRRHGEFKNLQELVLHG